MSRLPEIPAETYQDVSLVELVDRLLDKGVVLAGDVTLSVAEVDLVRVSLRVMIAGVDRVGERA